MDINKNLYFKTLKNSDIKSQKWTMLFINYRVIRPKDDVNGMANKSELPHDKTNKMACAPSEDSDQPRHPPSLIRVFAVRMKKAWVISYPLSAQRRLWSDWADAQADLSLRRVHSHFVGFVMSWLICRPWLDCSFRRLIFSQTLGSLK